MDRTSCSLLYIFSLSRHFLNFSLCCVPRKEWLQLWDHLLAYAERPQLLLYAVIGYVMQQRAALLDARTKGTAMDRSTDWWRLELREII